MVGRADYLRIDNTLLEPGEVAERIIEHFLRPIDAEVTLVGDGRQAVEILQVQAFDVVLMDMQMPELDGLAATAMLRAHERANRVRRTPVIMLTANAMDEHVKASHDAGADLHLSKPIQAQALIGAILQMIDDADQGPAEAVA